MSKEITKIKNKLDKIVSAFCRSMGKCEKCGSTLFLQWCHIITRGISKLRYDRRNWFCLCASCHRHFHNKPLEFAEFVKKKKGKEVYNWLIRESNNLKPMKLHDYQEILIEYTDGKKIK